MIKNAKELMLKFRTDRKSEDSIIEDIRDEIAIIHALTTIDVVLGEADVIDSECLQGFYSHWNGIKNDLLTELSNIEKRRNEKYKNLQL